MRINIQSSKGTTSGERFLQEIERLVESNLSRFGGRITKVDVLLIDENTSAKDKGCVIEAQLAGAESVAVRAHAGTLERAVTAGTEKMEAIIDHALEARHN